MSRSSNRRRSASRRLLSLWIPRLPTDRLKRVAARQGRVDELPLVLVAKEGSSALILSAVDAQAARLGLKPGLALTDARARHPALDVVPADEAADAKLLSAIADDCERYTPLIGKDRRDGLLLDITGASHLFGGEAALLRRIVRRLKRQGFTVVHVATAGTAAAARALSRFAPGTIVAPGGEEEAVRPLPVEALLLDAAILHGLKRAGLKSIAAVASRNRSELAARFGSELTRRLDEAMGHIETPISPLRPPPDYAVEQNFAEPVANLDFVETVLAKLAARLGALLERDGEGAKAIEASFFRADGAVRRIGVAMGRPEREADILMRLLRTKLESIADPLDPGFGFDLIRLSATRWARRPPRALSLEGQGSAEDDLAALIDRLAARLGSRRVLRFQVNDTHIPERAATLAPAQGFRAAMWERLALQKSKLAKRQKKKSLSSSSPPLSSCPAFVPGIHGFAFIPPPLAGEGTVEAVDSWEKPGHDAAVSVLRETHYLSRNAESVEDETNILVFPSDPPSKEQIRTREDSFVPDTRDNVIAFAQVLKKASVVGAFQKAGRADPDPPHRPVRLFEKPEPIDDVLAVIPDGPPARFRWRKRTHSVTRAEGPERIAMEWWRIGDAHLTRDYFRIEDDTGLRLWLYRDGLYGQETPRPNWFVHGFMG